MRYTVHYLPLEKIKPALSSIMTERVRKLRRLIWDSVHLLAVRRNQTDGGYTIVFGLERYEHLRNHTSKTLVPCIVEENQPTMEAKAWFRRLLVRYPAIAELPRTEPAGRQVIRSFLKREPRFAELPRIHQLRVLLMGVRYKRTAVAAMRAKVDDLLSKPKPVRKPKR